MSVTTRQAYYTVTVGNDIAQTIVGEAEARGEPVLRYLAGLLAWAMNQGPCPHPPAVVEDQGVPQCMGCGEFL